MKKSTVFNLAAAAVLILFATACGQSGPTEEETANTEAIQEVTRLDSLSSELDSTANLIENQVDALKESLEEL